MLNVVNILPSFLLIDLNIMSINNNDIKKQRFKNVASKRVQKVLDSMDSLSKCSNKNNYEFEMEDVAKMLKAIKEKVRLLELSFSSNAKTTKQTFKF